MFLISCLRKIKKERLFGVYFFSISLKNCLYYLDEYIIIDDKDYNLANIMLFLIYQKISL